MANIVILDGYTANPGDLSWDGLRELGQVAVYDRTPPELVLERSDGAQALIINKTGLDRAALLALPSLRYVGVSATGYNVIDIKTARERNITVTNVPGYSTASVAQLTFALMLELACGTGIHSRSVAEGEWSAAPDFCYWKKSIVELAGLTLGIVGLGAIGGAVSRIARAFGMKVVFNTRNPHEAPDATWSELSKLFSVSDAVTLHCPLTDETARLVNRERLRIMKPSAYLINTSRGGLLDEAAVADALNSGAIAGAGLDVLSIEPPDAANPLLSAKNCVITPHVAWASRAARERLIKAVTENLRSFLAGNPINVVS